jgi:hypothetical protein
MKISPEKCGTMAYLGQNQEDVKSLLINKCLQAENFRYLGCEISYKNDKGIKKK